MTDLLVVLGFNGYVDRSIDIYPPPPRDPMDPIDPRRGGPDPIDPIDPWRLRQSGFVWLIHISIWSTLEVSGYITLVNNRVVKLKHQFTLDRPVHLVARRRWLGCLNAPDILLMFLTDLVFVHLS